MVALIYSLLFGLTLVSALLVVFSRHAVYSALYLVASMISMAGIFILINAQLAAVLQVLVYAGAIMVLFIFVIMLLNIRFFAEPPLETRFVRRLGAVLFVVFLIQAVILMIRFGAVEFGSGADSSPMLAETVSITDVAMVLLTQYIYAFEITSVLLLVSVVGAMVLARPSIIPILGGSKPDSG